MGPSDSTTIGADVTRRPELEASAINDLLNYDLQVVEVDEDEGDLEAGCLSCS